MTFHRLVLTSTALASTALAGSLMVATAAQAQSLAMTPVLSADIAGADTAVGDVAASGARTDLRARGDGETSWIGRRNRNAGFDTDAVATKFEAYVREVALARGFTTTLNEDGTSRSDVSSAIAWWTRPVQAAVKPGAQTSPMALATLIDKALANSLQLGVFAELPAIRSTGIDEAKGRYKPEFFTEARYAARNEPTTALSQTRGSERLNDKDASVEFGVRSRTRTGAEVTVSERFTDYKTNQITYNPGEQARSRTVLGVVQPLLRESGTTYNNSIQKIAELETGSALKEFARQSESHLLEINRTYWTLYLARSIYVQQLKARDAVADIVKRITSRQNVDSATLQVNRARAALAERDAELVRARSAVSNSEARLKALINAPELQSGTGGGELVPMDLPTASLVTLNEAELVDSALKFRPELQQAFSAYRTALLREGMAANESLPQLDLVAEGSLAGRDSKWKLGGAVGDAFGSQVGYQLGVRLAVPLGKSERAVRYDRRKIETNQQSLQVRAAVETVMLELEVSANEYGVAYREMTRRADGVKFATEDMRVLRDRWQAGISAGQSGTDGVIYLDQLLNAQERITRAEREFSESQATFQVAGVNLARARGVLLSDLGLKIVQAENERGLPVFRLVKG